MKKHAKAGFPVKVAEGPLKGRYFIVIDYLVNQFQGKAIEKLAKTQGVLLDPVAGRGYPIDNEVVFGKMYPEMSFACVHDKELQVQMQVVDGGGGEEVELPLDVVKLEPKKPATKKKKAVKKSENEDGPADAS